MNTNFNPEKALDTPDILTYLSILKYLGDYYSFRRSQDNGFSYENWSYEMGFRSRSTIWMVMKGERIVSDDFVEIFSEKNNFSEEQKNYLVLLAKYHNSKSNSLKKVYLDKILSNVRLMKDGVEIKDYIDFLSSSAVPIIQIVISFDGFKASEEKLLSVLNIEKKDLKKGLDILEKLGLIQSHISEAAKTKIWTSKVKYFQIPDRILDAAVNFFHKETTIEAARILDENIQDKRFRSIYFVMTEEEFSNLRVESEEFLTRVGNKYDNTSAGTKKLFKLNLQVYPVTKNLE